MWLQGSQGDSKNAKKKNNKKTNKNKSSISRANKKKPSMPNVSNDLSQKLYATMEKHKEVVHRLVGTLRVFRTQRNNRHLWVGLGCPAQAWDRRCWNSTLLMYCLAFYQLNSIPGNQNLKQSLGLVILLFHRKMWPCTQRVLLLCGVNAPPPFRSSL